MSYKTSGEAGDRFDQNVKSCFFVTFPKQMQILIRICALVLRISAFTLMPDALWASLSSLGSFLGTAGISPTPPQAKPEQKGGGE